MGVLLALMILLLLVMHAPAPSPGFPPASWPARKRDELPPGAVLTGSLYEAGYARSHPELCPRLGARTRLVILVSSAPSDAAARRAVRLTWGHVALRTDVAFGFMLGASPPELRAALDQEDELYGDLIEGRSVDSYSNLTLKTISMFEWLDTYCPHAQRMLKTDDDMFVNVQRLLAFAATRANATRAMWGNVARSEGAVYRDFAKGAAYLLTVDSARRLLIAALKARYLRLEDVFVTGALAARAGVRRVHHGGFGKLYNKAVTMHPCVMQRSLTIHSVRYQGQIDLWFKLLNAETKCTS